MQRHVLVGALVVACFALVSVHAGYSKSLVIDWGNEWTKVVIMNPHAKSALSRLEMAVNEQSNRKTPSVVGLTGDGDDTERVLGEDAAGLLYRSPSDAYGYLKRLLGQFRDSAAVTSYLADFPAGTHTLADSDARRTVRFARGSSGGAVSVEQMVVSLLQWCKRLGEQHVLSASGETTTIGDAVLLVPEYWNAKQRTLYTQLATLAGLNVKAVLNELTAVALDYGNRNLETLAADGGVTTRKVVFYNVGAAGTAASLVAFTKLDAKDNGFKAVVLATASDADVGGLDFDLAVREHLIAEFDEKNKKSKIPSIRTSKKAMAKLLREARDLKEQLSAGGIGTVQVEEIFEGKDFAVTLTREKFDELTRALIAKALAPIKELATRDAALLTDVAAIELYGGGVRIPALQNALLADYAKSWGGVLGKHIDGDEAGVFGAGLYATVIGGIPGTKKVELQDTFVNANGESADELSESDISALREALSRFDVLAKERAARQEARNKLETFVVELKDKLEVLSKKLSEDESDAIAGLVSKAQDWIDYEASKTTPASEYQTKLETLRDATAPLLKAATAKHEKDQAKAKEREAADEKKRERELKGKARERAQDKAYARAQAAKEQQKTKAKAAKAAAKASGKAAKDTKPAAAGKKAGKKSGDKTEL